MLWILVTVLVGLFVIVVQLLLSYQRRAARLRVAQNPVRKQIKDYKEKITELGESVRILGNESLLQLKKDLEVFQLRSGRAANLTAELDGEAHAWVAERGGDEGEDEENPLFASSEEEEAPVAVDDEVDGILGARSDPHLRVADNRSNPVETVRAIRHELEETLQYIEGLRTDASLVQQSLQWLGEEKGKGKDGADGST